MFKNVVAGRWTVLLARGLLGVIFIGASIGKLQDQAGFINTVTGYGILPYSLGYAYGIALPWVELLIGCCLILGVLTSFAAVIGILAAISFGLANVYAMTIAAGDSCGCFGEMLPMSYPVALAVDFVMLGAGVLIVLRRDKASFLSLGHRISSTGIACRSVLGRVFAMGAKFGLLAVLVLGVGLTLAGGEESPIFERMDDSLKRGVPVVLVFEMEGCAACDEQKPVVARLKDEFGRSVTFVEVDYASESEVVLSFGVRRVPTIIVINCKQHERYLVYQEFQGFTEFDVLRECLEGFLTTTPAAQQMFRGNDYS